ncbi:MAG: primosomal protein N' [Gammaproteobacteria bacterium]|nr:primosomal protein N' [Gammaproteobacteria bacterium]
MLSRKYGRLSHRLRMGFDGTLAPMMLNSPSPSSLIGVAVPAPLRRTFVYDCAVPVPDPGCRVTVPFGSRRVTGVVINHLDAVPPQVGELKSVLGVLDAVPVINAELLGLLHWASEYYQYPLGEIVSAALPVAMRRGVDAKPATIPWFRVTPVGSAADLNQLRRAPVQCKIMQSLRAASPGAGGPELRAISRSWRQAVDALSARGWVEQISAGPLPITKADVAIPTLNSAQAEAVAAVTAKMRRFKCFLLHGITGSGKTEVYLQLAQRVLQSGRQVLILAPEIALTPQLVARFERRLGVRIAVLHSGLSDRERHRAWWDAHSAAVNVILGTRSAVFCSIKRLGLIIIDEEHDASYKQQDGFRYHARDVAIVRARSANIPILLGSATPSLETVSNVQRNRYQRLSLPLRAGGAELPRVRILDLSRLSATNGLTRPLLDAIRKRIDARQQSLIFLNRRGFAPVVICAVCGWRAQCGRCDAKMTLHRRSGCIRCHHCGASRAVPRACPDCGDESLRRVGEGTQRIEEALARHFPSARIVRLDRDSMSRRGALEISLSSVLSGEADILVGTQMLAKGHDFPGVTLVGIVNADQGLYSLDFRATEILFQQAMQVAGRAGRGAQAGEVLIQTMYPLNPCYQYIARHDFDKFADQALRERLEANYPPYAHFALLRSESSTSGVALDFLAAAKQCGERLLRERRITEVILMDPVPSPMEKRAGRYRAQLLVNAEQRQARTRFLNEWITALEQSKRVYRTRWSLDVDPYEMY